MWWPGPTSATWHEAHNSPGTRETGTTWALAEGEVGGTRRHETYVLIANTSGFAGSAMVTLLFEDGTSAQKVVPLEANSRTTINIGTDPSFAALFASSGSAAKRFGTIVDSLGSPAPQIVVERAMSLGRRGAGLGGRDQRRGHPAEVRRNRGTAR